MTRAERDELILTHLPHVHFVAARLHHKLCWMVNFEDVVSTGVIGLIAAVDGYDPSLGVRLPTYADYRIRGAILDSIRTGDGVAARQRKAAKRLRAALASVEQRLCRPAAEDEAAQELGVTVEEYRKTLAKVTPIRLRSLDSSRGPDGGAAPLSDTLADGERSQPSWALEREELRQLIRRGIALLPDVQQRVIQEYFFQGKPLRQIAEALGVHVTRVSQLKGQAIGKLRAYVLERWSNGKDRSRHDAGQRPGNLVAC